MRLNSFLLIILLILSTPTIYARSALTIDGTLMDYKWAHSKNELALLLKDKNEAYSIYIIDPKENKIIKKRSLMPSSVFLLASFDWTPFDDSLVLLANSWSERPVFHIYLYSFEKDSMVKFRAMEELFKEYDNHVYFDWKSIKNDNKSGISTVSYEIGSYGEGPGLEEPTYEPFKEQIKYESIFPMTGNIIIPKAPKKKDTTPKDITNTSFDNKYYIAFKEDKKNRLIKITIY